MVTLTRFLESIMVSTLLGLPREIKELIYFDALSHAANKIIVRLFPFPLLPFFLPPTTPHKPPTPKQRPTPTPKTGGK
jgi:hypothetical protein